MSNHLSAIQNLTERVGRSLPNGHTAVVQTQAELERLTNAMRALANLHATPDPSQPEAVHFKRVQAASAKLLAEYEAANQRMHGYVLANQLANDAKIKKLVNHVPNEKFGLELRAAVKAMPMGEKVALLTQLSAENRGGELFALTSAPTVLTGLTDELNKRYSEDIIQRHAPEEFAAIAGLDEARLTAASALEFVRKTALEYSDPARLASIQAQEKAASDAAAQFEKIVDPKPNKQVYAPWKLGDPDPSEGK